MVFTALWLTRQPWLLAIPRMAPCHIVEIAPKRKNHFRRVTCKTEGVGSGLWRSMNVRIRSNHKGSPLKLQRLCRTGPAELSQMGQAWPSDQKNSGLWRM